MGLLGALIVFAPRPLYLVHIASTGPGGSPARRPATGRPADVGAGDAALSRGGALARLVQPAVERAGAVTTLLKFVHLAAIAIWSGGLIALPFLFWQRRALQPGLDLDRLHRVTRLVYVELTSPAAFIAIGSGTALIFLQATSGMVLAQDGARRHHGDAARRRRPGPHAPVLARRPFRPAFLSGLTSAYSVLITAIIWVVLAKPHIDSNQFAAHLFEPGGLGRWLHQSFGETRMPMP